MIGHSDAKSVSIPVPDMSALIARLEAAEAGSRELDCLVDAWRMGLSEEVEFRTVGLPTYETPRYFCGPKAMDWIGYDLLRTSPAYTTSLDAALALAERVLPEADVWVGRISGQWEADCEPVGCERHARYVDHEGSTPALALCISVLKAMQPASPIQHRYEAAGEVSPNLKAKAQGG